MKNKKEHIDLLFHEAESSRSLKTSPDFMDRLNAKLDAESETNTKKKAPITFLMLARRYAAVILILILNVVLMVLFDGADSSTQQADIEVYAQEYFPDYATLASLED